MKLTKLAFSGTCHHLCACLHVMVLMLTGSFTITPIFWADLDMFYVLLGLYCKQVFVYNLPDKCMDHAVNCVSDRRLSVPGQYNYVQCR